MPSLHIVKKYQENGIYHVYNRGALGNEIFFDASDYHVFRKIVRNTIKIYQGEIILMTFALLPNHFHFLIQQKSPRVMSKFMQSVGVKYAMYLRKEYGHKGRLFQGTYRAVLLSTKSDILRIHQYISDNPITSDLHDWPHVGTRI